ncbi:SDR family oxidoreductase [Micromonospora sp. CPCC 205371]|nr:SDR family oxidoreductase [Micromonospora sp. CPCC 205371]
MTDNSALSGRVAIVTGATSGIGAAIARRLVAGGASVALIGRREDRLKELANELGTAALPVAVDITDQQAVYAAAATIRSTLGPADLVVANAGVMLAAPFEAGRTDEWDQMVGTNINGLLYTARAFIDDLLAAAADDQRADLVLVGSIGGHTVFPNYAVYTATKAAVAHLTRGLRAEFGPRGVRVKNVEPGFVSTELGDGMQDRQQREILDDMRRTVPPLPPEDIADVIAYATAAPARLNLAEIIAVPTAQG